MEQSGSGDPGVPAGSGSGQPPPPPASPPPAPATPPPAPTPPAGQAGLVYADVPNRAIAYIIDVILVAIIVAVISAIIAVVGLNTGTLGIGLILVTIVSLAISAGYFIYTWTRMRATVGMRVLGMQIGNAGDGATLTTEQGVRRWLAIAAPGIVAQVFAGISIIGFVLALAAFAWFIFLLWTTYQSPTKQGWHDHFANSQVVKAIGSVV